MASVLLLSSLPLPATSDQRPATASRRAAVDPHGVLRWQDTGHEVALLGVNYYPPFSIDYAVLRERGLSHEQAIRDDVAHFARLGLSAIRLHCWDREISDRQGNLVDNEHLRLLDLLIAECKRRGIYAVMTPIAWWGAPQPGGFSDLYPMPQMITDPAARAAQRRYLAQYCEHVNRYTGLAYKDDPAIVALELINEPQYAPGTTDAQVTEYVNDLAAAIRGTGCRKPIFYNCWGGREQAAADSTLDGCTFGWYPTGLVSGGMLRGDYLPAVDDYPGMRHPALAAKAKIVYEFEAADVPGSVMYPAMARAFRSGGAQIATQFQYDPLCIAAGNPNWQTHYLNLAYTPGKALSLAIAAEVFRRVPRLARFGTYPQSARFGDFRLSYKEDLSELVTADTFLYTNTTQSRPPDLGKLRRIAGCGSSAVVSWGGTGAYFLDRVRPGVWQLQLYPDAVTVADPYTGGSNEKVRLVWGRWPLEVHLPDLGSDFALYPCGPDRRPGAATSAKRGRAVIGPGEYLLVRRSVPVPTRAVGVPYVEPPAAPTEAAAWLEVPAYWREGRPCPVAVTAVPPGGGPRLIRQAAVALHVRPPGSTDFVGVPLTRKGPYRYAGTIPSRLLPPGKAAGKRGDSHLVSSVKGCENLVTVPPFLCWRCRCGVAPTPRPPRWRWWSATATASARRCPCSPGGRRCGCGSTSSSPCGTRPAARSTCRSSTT